MPPPARLLDLTRLVSRLGRGVLTGVDRVEYAYLVHLLGSPEPLFGLVRSGLGFLLLDRVGMQSLADQIATPHPLPPADLLSRLIHRHDPPRARAETFARRLSLARCPRPGLARLLRRHLPPGFSSLNTGHANLTPRSLAALRAGGAGRIAVLLHDTIPLDHPEFARPGSPAIFARKLAAAAAHADVIIHSAQATRTLTDAHLARAGRVPRALIAPLGVDLPHPARIRHPAPYFVTLGTIEPRKNHALLLDVWALMHQTLPADRIPHLLILGHRGWSNAATFARLDSLPFIGQTVFERPGLPDDQVFALLAASAGLLFPSHAEGYGLPPIEAAALGVPVVLPPLPIYRETLGDYPVYLSTADSYSWMETILRLSKADGDGPDGNGDKRHIRHPPTWAAHFNTVLNLI